MNIIYSMLGEGGHTELTFKDDGVTVDWQKTSAPERKLLTEMIKMARKKGLDTYSLDDEDKPVEVVDTVPGMLFNRKGRILIKGSKQSLRVLAGDLIETEIRGGKVAMEATKDGQWKFISIGEIKTNIADEKETKPLKVVSQPLPGGG